MKKIALVLILCLLPLLVLSGFTTTGDMGPVLQEEDKNLIDARNDWQQKASLPSYEVWINGQLMENDHAKYPILTYKDVTYIPLTYDLNRFMGINLRLYMAMHSYEERYYVGRAESTSDGYTPILRQGNNPQKVKMQPMDKDLQLNNMNSDNRSVYITMDPPPFIYEDIIYLPLSYEIVVEEFGWAMSWDGKKGLSIDTTDPTRPIVFVPNGLDQHAPFHYMEDNPYDYACEGSTYVGIRNKASDLSLNNQIVVKEKGQPAKYFNIKEFGGICLIYHLPLIRDELASKGALYPQLEGSKFTFIGVSTASKESMEKEKENLYLITLDIVTEQLDAQKLF